MRLSESARRACARSVRGEIHVGALRRATHGINLDWRELRAASHIAAQRASKFKIIWLCARRRTTGVKRGSCYDGLRLRAFFAVGQVENIIVFSATQISTKQIVNFPSLLFANVLTVI
jgi:hypothetical protein